MTDRQRWAILGGGMLGLTLAHHLAPRGHSLSVFELDSTWGGLAAPQKVGNVTWDQFYHVILSSDLRLRGLLAELGLESQLCWTKTKAGFYSDGSWQPMNGALDYLRFPLLGLLGKARLACTLLDLCRRSQPSGLSFTGLEDYLRRMSGDRVFEQLWLPLLCAKLGENYRRVSAAFLWAVVRRLLAARRGGLSEELFGYLPGGYGRIVGHLVENLRANGVALHAGRGVASVSPVTGGRLEVQLVGGMAEEFDRVIVTLPSPEVARLCKGLTAAEREGFQRIEYQGVLCMALLARRQLTENYLTYITDESMTITTVVEMSNLVKAEEFGGHTLLYLPKYVTESDPLLNAPDEEIRALFLSDLRRMHPCLHAGYVVASNVARARRVFALPVPGYGGALPPMKTSVPGLYVVNSSYIENGTLNVNETVGLAEDYVATC